MDSDERVVEEASPAAVAELAHASDVAASPPRIPWDRAALIAAVALAGAAVWVVLFAVPHGYLSVRISQYGCRVAPASGACAESHARLQLSWILPLTIDYVGWAAAGMLLVLAGRRLLATVPAMATVLLPVVLSTSDRWAWVGGKLTSVFYWPASVTRFTGLSEPPWLANRVVGALLAFMLVLAPAVVAFLVLRPRPAPRPGPRQVAGVALVLGSVAALAWLIGPFNLIRVGDAPSAVAVVALGAGLGASSLWRRVALATLPFVVTSLVSIWSVGWAFGLGPPDPRYITGALQGILWVGVAFAAAEAANPHPVKVRLFVRSRAVPPAPATA